MSIEVPLAAKILHRNVEVMHIITSLAGAFPAFCDDNHLALCHTAHRAPEEAQTYLRQGAPLLA